MPNPFAYVELHSKDTTQAKEFYRRLFDWKLQDEKMPDGRTYTMIYPETGFPGGMNSAQNGAPSHWLAYVQVDDVRAATQKAKELGATIVTDVVDISEGSFSVLQDPTGAALGLWQPKEKKQ